MSWDVLHALLWRARSGLRIDRAPLFAGHGVADPNYRPPRLPYVSVIGPLNLETESEREPPRAAFLWVQTPGFLAGAVRGPADAVPASGPVRLRVDGDAEATLAPDLDALAGQPFDDATGRQVAAAIQAALVTAVDAGGFAVAGVPVDDAARRAELRQTAIRWDRAGRRLVLSSPRRGVLPDFEQAVRRTSRIEVLDGGTDPAAALGLGAAARAVEGRLVRHRVPSPTAVAIDMRLDLWAGSQQDLAVMFEQWARLVPVRSQLPIRPALLAADATDGAQTLTLQAEGEVPNRATLLQLGPEGGFADRRTGEAPVLAGGAVEDAGSLRFTGAATATYLVFESPPIPQAWDPQHPGAGGFALTAGLRLDPGAAAGPAFRILSLDHASTVLRLDIRPVDAGGAVQAELQATATQAGGAAFAPAVAAIPAARLEAGVDIHILVDARAGIVSLFADGQPLAAAPTVPAPGPPAGGHGMLLTVGDPGGLPVGFRLSHLHLQGRPYGPIDPLARRSLSRAVDWSIGDPVVLARSDDGFSATGDSFGAVVTGIDGDTLRLDRPIVGTWPRGATLVQQRSLFMYQKQLRRRDDLINALYRITLEYRVSTYLDDRVPGVTAPLAEVVDVQLRDLARQLAEDADPQAPDYPGRPATGSPGVRPVITRLRRNESRP